MIYQMKLVVGEGESKVEIETVPQVMATASPVFRSMLQPDRFFEGQKLLENKPLTVTLSEDDPAAMKLLCKILHFQADKVPVKKISLTLLASIATVVDKYDCAIAIQPWPKLWLTQLLSLYKPWNVENMTLEELANWTHISYHLGYEDQFRECTSSLIRNLKISDIQGNQQIAGYEQLSPTVRGKLVLMLATQYLLIFIGAIQSARDKCILSFWEVCHQTIEDLKQGKTCKNYNILGWSYADVDESMLNCSALLLGSGFLAAQELCKAQDWEKVDNWQESPAHYHSAMLKFSEKLNSVRKVAHLQSSWNVRRNGEAHQSCGLSEQTNRQVETIYKRAKVGLELQSLSKLPPSIFTRMELLPEVR
jgi:hypothetical protein